MPISETTVTVTGGIAAVTVDVARGPAGPAGSDASVTQSNITAAITDDAAFRAAIGVGTGTGDLLASNNLSDLADAVTARSNLGLGTAATTNSTDYATAAQGSLADTAVQPAALDAYLQLAGGVMTGTQTFDSGAYASFGSGSVAFFLDGAEIGIACYAQVTAGGSFEFQTGTTQAFNTGSIAYFANGTLKLRGSSFNTSLNFTDPTAARTITFPNASGTVALTSDLSGFATLTGTETLTNKTLSSPIVAGNLTVDTNTLFVDATNNRVGIGTTSPQVAMDIYGEFLVRPITAFASITGKGIATRYNTVSGVDFGELFAYDWTVGSYKDIVVNAYALLVTGDGVNGKVGVGGTTTPTESLDVTGNIKTSGNIRTGGYTVGTLPTGAAGMRAYVTDANATTYLSTVAGGGSNIVPVFHDGTNWKIA